ncbi:MAG: AmmeMemoRadiSam system radical SAM enzyme [Candidatus Binatia bacterium]|nr:MAG: AmmeMemoRadiSam system radical SAM enzyme [Candidatus Binatia bacterium]
MSSVREALFWHPLPDGKVRCTLCALDCKISRGRRGACGVRVNVEGKLFTLVYGRLVARHVDPIEKKPLFHFLPGSLSYSIATVGCNFRCLHCQNYEISQAPKEKGVVTAGSDDGAGDDPEVLCLTLREAGARIPGEDVSPEEVVNAALRSGCRSISYTYTEPTIFYEFALDTARLAHSRGLRNVFVTNGYIGKEALETIAPYLDAANIDLKSFRDTAHKQMTGARLAPVLENIRRYKSLGVWVEVTTLVIPQHNDSDEELRAIAEFLASVDRDLPWHVTQFYPTYRLLDRPRTPVATLRRAREIGIAAGLRFVYEGNVPGEGGENTYCPECHALLVGRYGFTLLANRIADGRCPDCGAAIAGIWQPSR